MKDLAKSILFLLLLIQFMLGAQPSHSQPIPPDELLEDDGFDSPPPGSFIPPPTDPSEFNNFQPPPPGGFNPSPGGVAQPGGATGSGVGAGMRKRKPISDALSDEITNENYPDLIDSFDYPNAEITDVIKAMSELTGKNFIIDPGVRGKITIIAPTKITVAEAWRAFLTALAINNWTLVPSGKFYKVKNARDAQNDSIETYSGAYAPDSDQMITRIVHLKHISANDVNTKLRQLNSKSGIINVYEATNTLIISDFGSNVERVMSIVRELDVAGFEEQLEVIRIRHAKAKDIADLMDQIINKGERKNRNAPGGGFTSGIPRFGQPQQRSGAGEAFSLVIPDDRTNSIIIVGNKAGIQKIKDLVKKLDRKIRADEAGGVYVYYVKYGDAEKIAQTLGGIAQEAKKSTPSPMGPPGLGPLPSEQVQPIFGNEVKVAASKETNSLIVTASRQDYQTILELMRKLDIPRDQVFVEAIIMEMGAGNTTDYGVSYFNFQKDASGNAVGRVGFGSGNLATLLNPTAAGAILGFGQGDSVKVATPDGKSVEIKSTLGFVNFLKSVTTVNILSTPQILAMDNELSTISVVQRIPVSTSQNATSTGVSTGVNLQDTGITLKIKPHISRTDDTVRMEFDQEVSDVSPQQVQAKNLADSAISTTKRQVVSHIVVKNGDTAILGGLVRDEDSEQVQKVPLLGDIPVLGWLFKGKNSRKTKSNLLIFLTPRILRTSADNNRLLSDKLIERNDFIRNNFGGRDSFGTVAEKLARGADSALRKIPRKAQGPKDDSQLPANTDEDEGVRARVEEEEEDIPLDVPEE